MTPATPATTGSSRGRALRTFLRNPLGVVAATWLTVIVLAALLAPLLAPVGPDVADLRRAFEGAAPGHPLGFDSAGRDVLARIVFGARYTLGGAGIALAVGLTLGVPTGLVAGYYGRWFESAATWVTNLVMSLPAMVVLLASRAILGPTIWVLMVIMGVLVSPGVFRLTRSAVANVRSELYLDAARVSGLPDRQIIARHVLVVVRAPIIIQAALIGGIAIGLQAGLEFLGISSGGTPTWGAMLNDAFQNIQRAPTLLLWPGVALGMTTGSLVLLAAALRDLLEDREAPVSPRALRAAPCTAPHVSPDAEGRASLLSVRGLQVAYVRPDGSDKQVVRDVSLDVEPGQVLGLVGESGCGKTQSAFAVLGLLPEGGRVAAGSVTVRGREILGLSARERVALRGDVVAYIPQEPMSNLDPAYRIGQQLVEPIRHKLGLSRREARERALDLLRQVEIRDPERTMRLYPHQISGGMAQRVLIASAMSCDPLLVIADEPTTALDVTVQAEVLQLLRRFQEQRDLGVLLVTHNLGVVADLCDTVAVMKDGEIVDRGPVGEVFASPSHPYTRSLFGAVLDGTEVREPWTPPVARQEAPA